MTNRRKPNHELCSILSFERSRMDFHLYSIRIRKFILILVIVLLVFIRTFTESYLVQFGLKNSAFSDFYSCTIIGYFLKFKYQILLDILSFGIYYLLLKQFLNYRTKKGLISSGLFVLIFMFTGLYEFFGSLLVMLFPGFIMKAFAWNASFYWSFESFLGMLIAIGIMTLVLKKIRNERTTQHKTH